MNKYYNITQKQCIQGRSPCMCLPHRPLGPARHHVGFYQIIDEPECQRAKKRPRNPFKATSSALSPEEEPDGGVGSTGGSGANEPS